MSTSEPVPEAPRTSDSPGADRTWFVVPLFNEGEVVGDVLRDLRTRYPLVVCVDDGSQDDSGRIAEEAGACAVMALERVPADIRAEGGVARMSDPGMIKGIQEAVTIPVMAKARIGHFVECQILEALGVDYIDESEVLTPADDAYHVEKSGFGIPFVCGCRNLPEALRRIAEGAAMIRTKGEAGTGDVVEAVKHMRQVNADIARARAALNEGGDLALRALAREFGCDAALLKQTAELGRLPDGWPRADVLAAFVDAFRAVWFLLLALALLGLVCVSLMKQHKLHSTLSRNERD